MPDQYTLAKFQQFELDRGHMPVMGEIDLVSSHTPWTPLPRMVPWNRLGDGSIFDAMPGQGVSPGAAWQNSATVRRLYGQSIRVLHDCAHVVDRPIARQESRRRAARRPPAINHGQRLRRHPRRPDLDRRARPVTSPTGSRPGTGRRLAARARTRRCGRWTHSATSSSTPSAAGTGSRHTALGAMNPSGPSPRVHRRHTRRLDDGNEHDRRVLIRYGLALIAAAGLRDRRVRALRSGVGLRRRSSPAC